MTQELTGVFRAVLAAAGGGLIAKGYADAATVDAIAGAVAVLFTAIWSIYQKRKAKKAE